MRFGFCPVRHWPQLQRVMGHLFPLTRWRCPMRAGAAQVSHLGGSWVSLTAIGGISVLLVMTSASPVSEYGGRC